MTHAAAIDSGLDALKVVAPDATAAAVDRYIALILKWNAVHNLTAIVDPARMIVEHVLDSVSIAPLVRPARVLDVGSGAGFPGIPLALVRPQWQVTLLDSSHKRCAFLRQAVMELALTNVDVICARAEQFHAPAPYDTIVARAFAQAGTFVRAAYHALDDDGIMIAMKGAHPREELASLPASVAVREVIKLRVPGLQADRHAIIMTKA